MSSGLVHASFAGLANLVRPIQQATTQGAGTVGGAAIQPSIVAPRRDIMPTPLYISSMTDFRMRSLVNPNR